MTTTSCSLDWIRRESRCTARTGLFTIRVADPKKLSPVASPSTTGCSVALDVMNRFNTVDGVNRECTQSIDLFASGSWELSTQHILSVVNNCSSLFPLSPFEEERGEKEWWTAEISDSLLIRGNDQFTITFASRSALTASHQRRRVHVCERGEDRGDIGHDGGGGHGHRSPLPQTLRPRHRVRSVIPAHPP